MSVYLNCLYLITKNSFVKVIAHAITGSYRNRADVRDKMLIKHNSVYLVLLL